MKKSQHDDDVVVRTLTQEYATFFQPMQKEIYSPNVEFIDPLNSFSGIQKYQDNVDLLGGRAGLGKQLFEDASIALHNVKTIPESLIIETRWTLQVTVKVLPWRPRARFTGISRYHLHPDNGKIVKQVDYWDSVNLINGVYSIQDRMEGVKDFWAQVQPSPSASLAAPELPYELLRRARYYEVRRYPEIIAAETSYRSRPEGYDRLASYCSGSNSITKKVEFFAPTLMKIMDTVGSSDGSSDGRVKVMSWPLRYLLPGQDQPFLIDSLPEPSIPGVNIVRHPSKVVAVLKFERPATEPSVKQATEELTIALQRDGLLETTLASSNGDRTNRSLIVGQFDALFSLNKRRNEVWIELTTHPWSQ
eukprot:gene8498-9367_t